MRYIKYLIKTLLSSLGYEIRRPLGREFYVHDSLCTNHNHDFMNDATFVQAYTAAMVCVGGRDYRTYWRVHISSTLAVWAGQRGEGVFVECGVADGATAMAALTTLELENLKIPVVYLFDTFSGFDPNQIPNEEIEFWGESASERHKRLENSTYLSGWDYSRVKSNFLKYPSVRVIKGRVPEVLHSSFPLDVKVAWLHIDMNNSVPEVAAMDFFKDKLLNGALVLLDDYAYQGYGYQKMAMDTWARANGKKIISLPTGQGLLIWT
jgi:hypothetical protein